MTIIKTILVPSARAEHTYWRRPRRVPRWDSRHEQSPWDVCIMDVTMSGKSGTDLLQELIRVRHCTPILVLSMHPESTYAVRMIVSGASGYLNKAATSATQLTMAIKTLLSGHKYITQQVAEC